VPAFFLVAQVFPEPEKLITIGIRLAWTLGVAIVLLRLLYLLVARIERWILRAGHADRPSEQRARTIGQTLRHLVSTLVWGGAVIHALDVFGWDVKPLLAGAGILGVALGFGAQTLVRDLIAGFFILAENQFSVGDLIEANGTAATVEAVSLRFTQLRDFNGYVHFVPNGEMKVVTNRSRGWNRIAVDVLIAADQDLDRALGVCRKVVAGMNADADWRDRLLDPIELWGVESLVGEEVQLRMVVRARPGPDAPEAARELRRRVHLALAEASVRTRSSREIAIATPTPSRPAPLVSP
jgi:moderate conductance mechanosensitive channel